MDLKKGKLIVLEGTDGSGKTVQTNLLIDKLTQKGYHVKMTDFPQYGRSFFAKMIEKYLKGEFGWPEALRNHLKTYPLSIEENSVTDRVDTGYFKSRPDEVNPYLTSILYAGDRWEAKNQMCKWLDTGNMIISNRYVCSNMAHQGAKVNGIIEREKFFEWIDELEYKVYSVPRADITIYLHVPIEISQKLIKLRIKESEGIRSTVDLHEEDTEYMKRVYDIYLKLASRDSSWYTIECVRNNKIKSREKIAEEVWIAVREILT